MQLLMILSKPVDFEYSHDKLITFYLAIGLNRRRYTDVIASCPPILIVLAFKIFLARPLEKQFTYYEPTPQEAEEEFQRSLSEKRTHHSEMEKRFLHPALQSNMLFAVSPHCLQHDPWLIHSRMQVMVHKSQEALAREILSEYPWFNKSRHNPDAIDIKAVRPVSSKPSLRQYILIIFFL